jgi:hypothetical protein
MATPSCPDVVLLALTAVSCVSVVHTTVRPIIPDIRPLNCAFCLTLWVASGIAAHLWTLEALWAIPLAGFFAVIAAGQWPWAFYTTAVTAASATAVLVAEPDQPSKV